MNAIGKYAGNNLLLVNVNQIKVLLVHDVAPPILS